MTKDAIESVLQTLRGAVSFQAVFGSLPKGSAQLQHRALRKQFAYLARVVHPDLAPKGSEVLATEAFRLLTNMKDEAERAIERGTYERDMPTQEASGSTYSIRSATAEYMLSPTPFAEGDFSSLFRARATGEAVVVKLASQPAHNVLLEKEARLLREFYNPKRSDLSVIKQSVPQLLDTFLIDGEKGTRYRALVMKDAGNMVSVTDIMAAYPHGLEPMDAAWIGRRIIAQTLAASMCGVVHGAIVPDHVLVEPLKREPLHIGWLHATEGDERIRLVIDRWRDWYPPEVWEKKQPTHGTDLYMAAKTILALMGGDVARNTFPAAVPKSVSAVLVRCLEKSSARRPHDGRIVLDEFTRAIRSEWGVVYRPLVMPVH